MNICIYGASSDSIASAYLRSGEAFGMEMAKRGHSLVFGGGASGMMGAIARGVSAGCKRYGTHSDIIGIAPNFFQVDGVLYDGCTEMIATDTMRERKQAMENHSDAFVMTPGGIGTFEEFFEILTLRQLQQHNKPIALWNICGYFDDLLTMLEKGMKCGFIQTVCRTLFFVENDICSLLDRLENEKPQPLDPAVLRGVLKKNFETK